MVLHGCPLVTIKNLTSSETAGHQLYFSFGIISSVASKICRLIIECGEWVDDYLCSSIESVVPWTGGHCVRVYAASTLELFESLSLCLKFVHQQFWTLLRLGLVYSVKCKVFNYRPSILLSLNRARIVLQHTITLLKLKLQQRLSLIHLVSLLGVHM